MTGRLHNADTQADIDLRNCLSRTPPASFVVIAGAGSGKTTSLVKAIHHLIVTRGAALASRKQQIACITYTELAAREIMSDVESDSRCRVSTIHSFFWEIIKPFQADIKKWVFAHLQQKFAELEAKKLARESKPTKRSKSRDAGAADKIAALSAQITAIDRVKEFVYGTGSDYAQGVLGHTDILAMVPNLIETRSTLRIIVGQRYPYLFVDESQDATPETVHALCSIESSLKGKFCLGFFGDPMQKIYMGGVGDIEVLPHWMRITKQENFRCSTDVLRLINNIRRDGDGLVQQAGIARTIPFASPAGGSAQLFVVPRDDQRDQRLSAIRSTLNYEAGHDRWTSERDSDVRLLVLVHKMAARRLGFGALYEAMNERAPSSFKDGLLGGTAWPLRPFIQILMPLTEAALTRKSANVMDILRTSCPLLAREHLLHAGTATTLQALHRAVAQLAELLSPGSAASIGDVLRHAHRHSIVVLDERLTSRLNDVPISRDGHDSDDGDDDDLEARALAAFLACPANQLWGYWKYVRHQSPFETHQGVKGTEYERVIVIADDEEGAAHRSFSYDKYFGLAELAPPTEETRGQAKESVVERTRRLFYVCCSRAMRELAIVVFVDNVDTAFERIKGMQLLPPGKVRKFVHLVADAAVTAKSTPRQLRLPGMD